MARKTTHLAVALLALAIVASGCGGGGTTSSSSGTKTAAARADVKVAAEVPAGIKSKGTLTVATDATYAPNEFIGPDGHTIEGMDPDLAKALAGVMGLKANVANATFDSIIPGLAARKYDLSMSSFGDTKAREHTVDFVTYFAAGTSFYVKTQGGPNITKLADLCGHTAAVEKGTTQQIDATAESQKCRAAGKRGVTVLTFPDQNGANLALSSGRADVGMADSPPASYLVRKSNGRFKLVGQAYNVVRYGIALPKRSGLAKPMLDAMKAVIADGKYVAILKKWGIQQGAIRDPRINAATS